MSSITIGRGEIAAALVHGPSAIMVDGITVCEGFARGLRRVTRGDMARGPFGPIEMGLQTLAAVALQGRGHRDVAVLKGWLRVNWRMPEVRVDDRLEFEFPRAVSGIVNGREVVLDGIIDESLGFTLRAGTTLLPGPEFNDGVQKCLNRDEAVHAEPAGEEVDRERNRNAATLWEATLSRVVVDADVRDHFCRRYGLAEIVPGYCLITWAWQAACNCLTNKGLQPIPRGEMKFKFGVPALVGQTVVTHVRVMRGDWDTSTGIGTCKVRMEANGHTLMFGSFDFQTPRVRQPRQPAREVREVRQLVGAS